MITDVADPARVQREPDGEATVFEGSLEEHGTQVTFVGLRLYVQHEDDRLGPYSLITSVVRTGEGAIEMSYDEGYRGPDALGSAARFLGQSLGISGLILRSVIAIRSKTNT